MTRNNEFYFFLLVRGGKMLPSQVSAVAPVFTMPAITSGVCRAPNYNCNHVSEILLLYLRIDPQIDLSRRREQGATARSMRPLGWAAARPAPREREGGERGGEAVAGGRHGLAQKLRSPRLGGGG